METTHSFSDSLEEVRARLVWRLSFGLIGFGILAIWYVLVRRDLLFSSVLIPFALVVFSRAVQVMLNRAPVIARHIFVWGITAHLLVALITFNDPLLAYFSVPCVFVSAMLMRNAGLANAVLFVVVMAALNLAGVREYPLFDVTVVLTLAAGASWLSAYTLFTVVHWYSTMQLRSQELLDTTREHRAELSQALRSLQSAYENQRHIQLELVWACKHAEDARRLKEQFVANISHELWTPLNLILGFSEMMYLSPDVYGDVDWTPRLRQDIHQIYRNSQHLLALIGDILDLSRFEMTGFTITPERTVLTPFLKDTVQIAEHSIQRGALHFEFNVPDDLPVVEIDCTRIRQVILNLLNNACRFTEAGVIELSARQDGSEAIISIRDTGTGISSDKLPYIFDEFYQANPSLKRSRTGAGLGLAISKRFVEAHHGRIWVESEEGVGSCFSFALPTTEQLVGARARPVEGRVSTASDGARRTALVVGAESAALSLLERALQDCEVIPVRDVRLLPEMVLTHHPKMIVHNVNSDEPTATHTFADLGVPVVECSLPGDTDAGMAKELDVRAYLTKPVNAQTLLEAIGRVGVVRDILIALSDRGLALLVERMLESVDQGYVVRRVYDYEQVLAAVTSRVPELVLLDGMTPETEGLRLLTELRAQPEFRDVPVIVLTSAPAPHRTQGENRFAVYQRGGLYAGEVLNFLSAVFSKLSPRYYYGALENFDSPLPPEPLAESQ
ncbi:MAG: hybrid sensor histidine kinase/response regulator [Anaerolineae bacterium]|nr:hybrid sensor histidine kinase/response regulator [Anaerolineae bacterium]